LIFEHLDHEQRHLRILEEEVEYLISYGYFTNEENILEMLRKLLKLTSIFSWEYLHERNQISSTTTTTTTTTTSSSCWSSLVLNPPRSRRVAVDCIYELSQWVIVQINQLYPQDSIRGHVWMIQGKQLIQEYVQVATTTSNGTTQHSLLPSTSTTVPLSATTLTTANQEVIAFKLWLQDLQLTDYEDYFHAMGFRLLSDFEELGEDDCYRYFPFLKIGDARRLAKHCVNLNENVIYKYEDKAVKWLKKQTNKK
jgi:hypothetical protein